MQHAVRIMIVDDHTLFRDGLRLLLEIDPNCTVVGMAASSSEAIQVAATCVPDVVLMDIDMPGEGGIAALKQILKQQPNCRILLLTGHRDYVVPGLHAGACGYVLKDAKVQEIVEAIHTAMRDGVYLHLSIQSTVLAGLRQQGIGEVLSERDITILRLVALGKSNREIGEELGLSESGTKYHLLMIREKLGATDRASAVAIAKDRGLI